MNTPFLKTYYRRKATVLTPEQIEEIRMQKNKVPIYRIKKDYHIREEHVLDIWKKCERLQQDVDYNSTSKSKSVKNSDLPIINGGINMIETGTTDNGLSHLRSESDGTNLMIHNTPAPAKKAEEKNKLYNRRIVWKQKRR
nr:535_t:CDS:2 [Entrophospora candida]